MKSDLILRFKRKFAIRLGPGPSDSSGCRELTRGRFADYAC